MKNFSSIIGSLLLVALGIFAWKMNYGPFTTGTTEKAFLNVTFGMSIPEVSRALDARLLDNQAYESVRSKQAFIISNDRQPDSAILNKTDFRFLARQSLFGSDYDAQFEFYRGELANIVLSFPVDSESEGKTLRNRIREVLMNDYAPYQWNGSSEDFKFHPLSRADRKEELPSMTYRKSYIEVDPEEICLELENKEHPCVVNVNINSLWYAKEMRNRINYRDQKAF